MNIGMMTTWRQKCGIASYSENLAKALADEGVNVYVVRIPRFGEKDIGIFQNTVDRIPADKIDLLHVQHEYGLYAKMNRALYPALRSLGKPVVTTMHATGFDDDDIIVESSDKVIVHNEYCRDRVAADHSKVEVIPHGMSPLRTPLPPRDVCKKRLGIQPEVPVVGYVGFISQYKGIEGLITAMIDVPNAGLLIGGGWFTESDTEYIVKLKQMSLDVLPHRCQWLGFVPDEDMAMTYGAMDIVVYPSKFMTESGAMLMALSHGKALVATNLPPVKEKVRDYNAMVTFKNTAELTSQIKLLLADKELREKYEENAKKFTLANSWANIAKKHSDLYQRM